MFDALMFRIPASRFFYWPNVLAMDAVAISLCWYTIFASASGIDVHFATASVLGLSVWLTYTADRLFDVAKRPVRQLHSIRHRFAKTHSRTLWKVWFGTLVINVTVSFASLAIWQLLNGIVLMIVCLLYTRLNQKSSSRFFPKELWVAIIYAAGVIVFLPPTPGLWLPAGILMLLCLTNCLIISAKEKQVDIAMNMRSMAQSMPQLPPVLYVSCSLLLGLAEKQWLLPFGLSLTALALVQIFRNQLSVESFRVLADTALLIGPLVTLLFAS